MSDEQQQQQHQHHPKSFLARFSRANNQLPAGKDVSRWLENVEDPDDDDGNYDDDMMMLSSNVSSPEEDMVQRPTYMQRFSSNNPLYHAHHEQYEPRSEREVEFDAEDLVIMNDEGSSVTLDQFDPTALEDMVLPASSKETSSPKNPPVVHYEGRTETYYPDGIQVDFDPIDFDEDNEERGDNKVATGLTAKVGLNENIGTEEDESEIKARRTCDTKGHLFKSDYSVYCNNCGENLDARRKYTCVADDCGIVFCPDCAKQDESRKPNVQYGKWLEETGPRIQKMQGN